MSDVDGNSSTVIDLRNDQVEHSETDESGQVHDVGWIKIGQSAGEQEQRRKAHAVACQNPRLVVDGDVELIGMRNGRGHDEDRTDTGGIDKLRVSIKAREYLLPESREDVFTSFRKYGHTIERQKHRVKKCFRAVGRLARTLGRETTSPDFSRSVVPMVFSCLRCKGCSSECKVAERDISVSPNGTPGGIPEGP